MKTLRLIKVLMLKELREGLRSKWLMAYSLSYLLLGLSLTQFSLMGVSYLGLKAVGRIMASLINLALYLVPLISLAISSISIVSEKETGVIEWLFSEPLGTLDYVLGKFLGLLTAVTLATLLGFGLASWITVVLMPPEDAPKYLAFVLVAIALSATSIGIGMLISATSKSRFEAFGTAFLLWFAMIFVYDLVIMGLTISTGLSEQATFILAVLNPVESSRILMIYLIDPMLTFLGSHGIYIARELGGFLPLLLAGILTAYTLFSLILVTIILRRSDVIS